MKVIWLEHAEQAMHDTEEYILQEYGEDASERFMREIKNVAYLLEDMPQLGHFESLLSDYPQGYRSIVVSHLNKLIYYIQDDQIRIAALWDTRREPKALAKNMK